jgi:hypothetical protein
LLKSVQRKQVKRKQTQRSKTKEAKIVRLPPPGVVGDAKTTWAPQQFRDAEPAATISHDIRNAPESRSTQEASIASVFSIEAVRVSTAKPTNERELMHIYSVFISPGTEA